SFVGRSVAGSVHNAEMPFVDSRTTGSISGSGFSAPGLGTVALKGKAGADEAPDEDRVNRADKRGRLVNVVPAAPPKSFNAGSVFQRTSMLSAPRDEPETAMAFVEPQIRGKEIEIAAAFHVRESHKADPGRPSFLASLVHNDKAAVLATAYAPAEPDYARASPFASLLGQEEEEAGGRFIPPVGEGDHAWMSKPLPEHVF